MAVEGSWAQNTGRRRNMQANRSSDTGPELALRSRLHARGLRYRVNNRPLPRVRYTADVVFSRARVAVFVDGCYWHMCPEHYREPSTNPEYWRPKLEGNVARDRKVDALLAAAGWIVIRVWEHEDPDRVANIVETQVRERT